MSSYNKSAADDATPRDYHYEVNDVGKTLESMLVW
jgi:hypothetical protein